jgi:hypothetical protein
LGYCSQWRSARFSRTWAEPASTAQKRPQPDADRCSQQSAHEPEPAVQTG